MKMILSVVALFISGLVLGDHSSKEDEMRTELDGLGGLWILDYTEEHGVRQQFPEQSIRFFEGRKVSLAIVFDPVEGRYHVDDKRKPAYLDILLLDGADVAPAWRMIYRLEGDILTIAWYGKKPDQRPNSFEEKGVVIAKLHRQKK
jgi:uncharacterized protein (TIGR03067 family)